MDFLTPKPKGRSAQVMKIAVWGFSLVVFLGISRFMTKSAGHSHAGQTHMSFLAHYGDWIRGWPNWFDQFVIWGSVASFVILILIHMWNTRAQKAMG